jgi:hypothetical protein
LVWKLKEIDYFEDLDADGKILKWILKKRGGRLRIGWIWLATR